MNRLGGHPLLIFLMGAGAVVTVYSLTLLPVAVTFLVVGLVAIVTASMWLYRSQAPHPAEISNLVGIGHTPALNEPDAVDQPDDVSEPPPVETAALLPEQWQMLQRWMDLAAQAHAQPASQPEAVIDDWAPPDTVDAWEPEPAPPAPAAPAAQTLAVLLPDPVERTPLPASLPAAQEVTPQADTVALAPEEAPTPAPPLPPLPRRAAPVFAQATTYQDGEITKRSQITLRLSGRMHR